MKNISIIVAFSENRVIGKNEKIPWYIIEDLKRFKQLTTDHTIIMGRKTWDSLPKKPLPNRTNIVITKNPDFVKSSECVIVNSINEALKLCIENAKETFIIGGEQIYQEFLQYSNKIYLTYIDKKFDGDAFFPELNCDEWKTIESESHFDEKSQLYYTYNTLIKI